MLPRVKALLAAPIKKTGVPPPSRVANRENEGDVYLFIHGIDAAHSATMPNYDIEHAHFSLIIDIAGESHGEIVSGYEICMSPLSFYHYHCFFISNLLLLLLFFITELLMFLSYFPSFL